MNTNSSSQEHKKPVAKGYYAYSKEVKGDVEKKYPDLDKSEIRAKISERWHALDQNVRDEYKKKHQQQLDDQWNKVVESSGHSKDNKNNTDYETQFIRKVYIPSDNEDDVDNKSRSKPSKKSSASSTKKSAAKTSSSAKKLEMSSDSSEDDDDDDDNDDQKKRKKKNNGGKRSLGKDTESADAKRKKQAASKKSQCNDHETEGYQKDPVIKYILDHYDEYWVPDVGPKFSTITFKRIVPSK